MTKRHKRQEGKSRRRNKVLLITSFVIYCLFVQVLRLLLLLNFISRPLMNYDSLSGCPSLSMCNECCTGWSVVGFNWRDRAVSPSLLLSVSHLIAICGCHRNIYLYVHPSAYGGAYRLVCPKTASLQAPESRFVVCKVDFVSHSKVCKLISTTHIGSCAQVGTLGTLTN